MKSLRKAVYAILIVCSPCVAFTSCDNEDDFVSQSENVSAETNDVQKIREMFESKNFQSLDEAAAYADSIIKTVEPITRALNEDDYLENSLSPEALSVIEQMKNLKVDGDCSIESLRTILKEIVHNSNLLENSHEYNILLYSIDTAIEVIYYVQEIQAANELSPVTRFSINWDKVTQVVRCVGGTVGAAGLGAISGATVGTVTLPIIGTVSGTSLGCWCGAMTGAATFC